MPKTMPVSSSHQAATAARKQRQAQQASCAHQLVQVDVASQKWVCVTCGGKVHDQR